jgi:hypothetical protein
MPVHEEVDEKRVGAPLRRQEGRSQMRADKAGPQLLHPGHGFVSMGARLITEAQSAFYRSKGLERLGFAGTAALGLAPRQSLSQHGQRLPRPACQSERPRRSRASTSYWRMPISRK